MEYRVVKKGYIPGDPYRVCDLCGIAYRYSETKKQWDGLIACTKCWSPKHPSLNPVKSGYDEVGVKDARSYGDPSFITTPITPDDL